MILRNPLRVVGAVALLCGAIYEVMAQPGTTFPAKPVKLVVPFAPAGPNDIIARIVAQKWSEAWGHPTVVENRGGAGGTIGVEYGAKAAPDGYTTIMGGASTLAVAVGMYAKLGYEPRELTPLTNIAFVPYVLAVNPHVPAKSIAELIAVAKAKKNLLSYGSSGSGAISHLAAELFKSMSGADIVHVPYKGTAPAVIDVIAGQIDLMIADYAAIAPHAKAGKLRMLATAGGRRAAVAPELPTIAEAGVKGYSVDAWFGLVAPPGVAKDIVAKINLATVNALKSTDVRQRFGELGYEPIGDTPEQFGATIRGDIDKYVRLIRKIGIKAE
jgi:tripartite-type tricarboxylate transporter receptor subunit TctC